MAKKIVVTKQISDSLKRDFKVTRACLWKALNFKNSTSSNKNGNMGNLLRKAALERGGQLVELPDSRK